MNFKIAVSMRVVSNPTYPEFRDAISHDWVRFLNRLNLLPILISNVLSDPVEWMEAFAPDALLLTNGDDVAINMNSSDLAQAFLERDRTERRLMDYALGHGLPVFGVCRGFQFINVYLGGTLSDVPNHAATEHAVQFNGKSAQVNSYHRQGVLSYGLAADLVPFAIAEDEVIEGYRHKSLPVWAVQWHPERSHPSHEEDLSIFQAWLKSGKVLV